MFEYENNVFTLEDLQQGAKDQGLDFDTYLEEMKKLGMVEKQVDPVAVEPAVESSVVSKSDDFSSQLPEVTRYDLRETEEVGILSLEQKFKGLGFEFEQTGATGDYITIKAPQEYEGQLEEERANIEVSYDMFWGNLLFDSDEKEAEKLNNFIKENYKKGETLEGINANIYAGTINEAVKLEKQLYTETGDLRKDKSIEDLSSQQLEALQKKAFYNMLSKEGVMKSTIEEIKPEMDAYQQEQMFIMSRKHDLTTNEGVANANKEFGKLIKAKEKELLKNSKEYEKLLRSINAGVVSKYGSDDAQGSLINRAYTLEAEEELLPFSAGIRKMENFIYGGDAIADYTQGFGAGRIQIAKGTVDEAITYESVGYSDLKQELEELNKRIKDGENPNAKYRLDQVSTFTPNLTGTLPPPIFEGTIQERIKEIETKMPKLLISIGEKISKSKDYQKKLARLDPAEIFDGDTFSPQLTTDEFQKMIGTQVLQAVGSVFVTPSVAQEVGGITTEILEIETARSMFPNLYKDISKPTNEEDKEALQAFRMIQDDKLKTKATLSVIEGGQVNFDPAIKGGFGAASLDVAGNVFAFSKAYKFVPKSVLRDFWTKGVKGVVKNKGFQGLFGAGGVESITELLQEEIAMYSVKSATGYQGDLHENMKRRLESAGQAFLTTPVITAGPRTAQVAINEFRATVLNGDRKQARTLINKKKEVYQQAYDDGTIDIDERNEMFTELEAIEDVVNNVDVYKKMKNDSKEISISSMLDIKNLEKQKTEFENANKKIKKEQPGAPTFLQQDNNNKIKEVEKEIAEKQNAIIKERIVTHLRDDSRLAEWINLTEEGEFKGKKFKKFQTKKEFEDYFSKLFEEKGWVTYAQKLEERIQKYKEQGFYKQDSKGNIDIKEAVDKAYKDFESIGDAKKLTQLLDMKRLYDGKANAAVTSNTAFAIMDNLVENVRKSDPTSVNAFHHEALHMIQENMSLARLKEIQIAVQKELDTSKDPKMQMIAKHAKAWFKMRGYADIHKNNKSYYQEWFSNLSDAIKYINIAKDMNDNSSETLFNVGKLFSNMFKKQTQMLGMDWSKFDAGNALEYLQKFNKFQGAKPTTAFNFRVPKGNVDTEKEDKKQGGKTLASEGIYQEINETFNEYVGIDKELASNVTADMMQGIVFDRLTKLKDAGLIEGFTKKDLEEIQLQFTGPVKDLPSNIKNRGAVALLKKYDPDFKGGVMGYFNATKRGRKMLDMRLQEFVENHPKYGNIQVSLQEEGVTRAVDAQETALSPEEIMIKKEEAKLTDLDKALNEGKPPKTDVLKTGKKQTREQIMKAVKFRDGDTFTEVLDIKNINGNTGKVAEIVFDVPAKKILDRNEDGKPISANLTYAKKIKDGIPEPSEAGNIQDYYANEQAIISEIKTLTKTNVASKDAEINKDGDKIKVSRKTLGRAIGLSNNVLNYFYNKKFKPDGKRARSQGLTSQVSLWEIKDEFVNPKLETIKKAQKEFFGITPAGKLNIYNKTIGQNLKGFAKHTASKKTLSAAARKSNDPQQIADIRAALSKTAFSESIKNVEDIIAVNAILQLETTGIDGVLKAYNKSSTFDLTTDKGRKDFVKGIKEVLLPLMPKEFWIKNGIDIFTGSHKNYGRFSMSETFKGSGIYKNPKERDAYNKLRDDIRQMIKEHDNFGADITDANFNIDKVYTTIFGDKDKYLQKLKDKNKIEQWNKDIALIHETMWTRFNEAITKDKTGKAAGVIGTYLKLTANDKKSWHRLGAQIAGYSLNITERKNGKSPNIEFEHAMPATAAYLYLMDTILNDGANFKTSYNLVMDNYKLILLDKAMDDKLTTARTELGYSLQKRMPDNWSLLENSWWERYFNGIVDNIDGGIDPNSIVDLDGKTFAEKFNIKKPVIKKEVAQTKDLNKAVQNVRLNKNNLESRGMSAFDFDETLIDKGENTIIATKGKDVIEISSGEWPIIGPDLAAKGYNFDFSDFINVRGGVQGPLMQKFRNRIAKYGIENNYILTARPPESAPAIQAWLKTQGIDMPLENITGLGNSTGEAKAMWIANKFSEGYNDIYFVDDALPNVKAVKNMIEQLDIKGSSVQAKVQFSEGLNGRFNNILENITGIESNKRFSDIKARKRGASKGKFRFFIPPSHEDFVGLLYNFMGKGKEGNAHRDFFEQALVRPLNRAYREIDTAKQAIANDYKELNKQFKDIKKKLKKKTPDGDFTFEDAIRVYLWDKHGYDISGLSPTDQQNLVNIVTNDNELRSYADTINVISKQDKYVDPGTGWEGGNIQTDLIDATGRVGRAEYLAEFKENADIIFSLENLNKIEAAYGADFRSALEDMLHRINTGINRPKGQHATVNALMNYLNGSVGTVMFFNARSAILQQMSIVNYINFADNNMFAAAKAFANQKQYWADFAFIFNSDMLKQRRGGIGTDINGADLAQAVAGSKNPTKVVVGRLLKLGFLPTQIGDNIAIATGGATFYRNRINKYLKDGLSKKEAEAKAFTDFQDLTQSTQQSSRPDMTSQQQASWIGKLVLNFQNITSQYNRIIKKAALDIGKGRISPPYTTKAQSNLGNLSKILYYGAIQNVLFYSLQTALFAVMFDDDNDEDQILKKRERVINGTIDSILRGSGIYGAVVSTLKNAIIKWKEQREPNYNKDESGVLMELLNFSPVVGIKSRMIVNAEKTLNYNENVINEMETFEADNPMWSAVTNYTQALTNFPANRLYQKSINMRNALDKDYTNFQRVLFFSGYTTWSLGLGDTEAVIEAKEKVKINKANTKKKTKKKRYRLLE